MRPWAALAGLALAACTQAPAGEGPPARRLPAAPRIVSLNPCSDAILAQVAGPDQLIAISHYSRDPASSSMNLAAARRFRAVSGSVEEVLGLRPDVIVTGTFVSPATLAAFRDLGLAVVQVPIANSVAEARQQVNELARIAGHPERGQALVARMDQALADAAPAPGTPAVSALVWQSGGIVPGDDTLIADLLKRTGYSLFSSSKGMKQAEILPLELLLADPPRVILAAGDPRSQEDRMLHHPALDRLTGTAQANFEPSLLWCGGPTVIRAAARLAQVRRTL